MKLKGMNIEKRKSTESLSLTAWEIIMRFDIERCLNDAEISYEKISHKYKNQPCTKFALDHCFFDAAHINNDACIFQYENGNIAFKCFHESCKNKTWKDARNYLTEKGIKFEKYWPNKPINNTFFFPFLS